MIRPTLELADIIRAQGERFIERSRSWLTCPREKCYMPSSVAAPPLWAAIGIAAFAAVIVPSRITRVLWEVLPNGECGLPKGRAALAARPFDSPLWLGLQQSDQSVQTYKSKNHVP